MMTPKELRQSLDMVLGSPGDKASSDFRSALGAATALILDDDLQACGGWFDYDPEKQREVGLHLRVLTAGGVITVDHDFALDAAPAARLLAWSRVTAINVVARDAFESIIDNMSFETEQGVIEFGGLRAYRYEAILRAGYEFIS